MADNRQAFVPVDLDCGARASAARARARRPGCRLCTNWMATHMGPDLLGGGWVAAGCAPLGCRQPVLELSWMAFGCTQGSRRCQPILRPAPPPWYCAHRQRPPGRWEACTRTGASAGLALGERGAGGQRARGVRRLRQRLRTAKLPSLACTDHIAQQATSGPWAAPTCVGDRWGVWVTGGWPGGPPRNVASLEPG